MRYSASKSVCLFFFGARFFWVPKTWSLNPLVVRVTNFKNQENFVENGNLVQKAQFVIPFLRGFMNTWVKKVRSSFTLIFHFFAS